MAKKLGDVRRALKVERKRLAKELKAVDGLIARADKAAGATKSKRRKLGKRGGRKAKAVAAPKATKLQPKSEKLKAQDKALADRRARAKELKAKARGKSGVADDEAESEEETEAE